MANRKFIYDNSGSVRELTSGSSTTASYYDDTNNIIFTKNVSFNNLSSGSQTQYGLPTISGSSGSVQWANNFDVVGWDSNKKVWTLVSGQDIDLGVGGPYTASSNSDISGNMNTDPKVITLRNVNSGSSLKVENGGTGLSLSDFSTFNGEALLVGNNPGETKLKFLTASADAATKYALTTNGSSWTYTTRNDNNATSSVEVSIFTSSTQWSASDNTKFVRVLVQGAGGGGGSGANRNNGLVAMGGGGGSSGGFLDSGIVPFDKNFTSTPITVTVGSGGLGGNYPTTNSVGNAGQAGGSSSFGTYFYASGGLGGSGGLLSASVTAGGASVTFGSRNLYSVNDINLVTDFASDAGDAAGSSSLTAGQSLTFTTSSTSYYGAGGGAGGGSLTLNNYTTNYNGGNAGTSVINSGSATGDLNAGSASSSSVSNIVGISDPLFVSSGGGGGASAKVTQSFDSGTLVLAHHNLSNPLKDNSVWNNTVITGATTSIISTGSVPAVNNLFSDGILSSSALATLAGITSSYYLATGQNIGNGSFSIESFFRLVNTGSSPVSDLSASCYLLNAGYSGGSTGCLLGINKSNGALRIWSSGSFSLASSVPITLNAWNHIVLQRSGSELQGYLNGVKAVSGSGVAFTNSVNNFFGYSLGPYTLANGGLYSFNGYAKELRVLNRFQTLSEIQATYSGALINLNTGSFTDPDPILSYAGGSGSNGAWGSGGGGGGASTNNTGSSVGTQQGGNGGNGYVAVISYKY